jgi:hypothetical protein
MPYTNSYGEKDIRTVEIDCIGRVPMATIPWDGYFLPKFKFDIDLSKAFDKLGEFNSVEVLKEGPSIIKGMKKKEKESKTEKISEKRDDARELYATLEESGCFGSKSRLLAHVGASFGKSMQWAWQVCADLPFDKSKYNPEVKIPEMEESDY